MIYQKYLPFESLLQKVDEKEIKLPFPLEYTLEWIEKIKKKIPKSYDNVAKRLGWSVEYLKAHIRKEERVKEVFEKLNKNKKIKKL